jgi:pyruvate, orthophosphate dikinase
MQSSDTGACHDDCKVGLCVRDQGDGHNKMLLGGKGANLCEMTRIGVNVPPGFVVTTEACLAYLADAQRQLPDGVMDEVRAT